MNIWGKLIGGATGFAIGGPIGGLLGTLAGHAIDSKIIPKYINVKNNYESIVFTAGVIALSAKMAKADGQVTKEEIFFISAATGEGTEFLLKSLESEIYKNKRS